MNPKLIYQGLALAVLFTLVVADVLDPFYRHRPTNSFVGKPGVPGVAGLPGLKGDRGPEGPKGETGIFADLSWKQCAWRRDDGRDYGEIQSCIFHKKHKDTSLRVFYGGNLRINNCNSCCKRWYFTFNENECHGPLPIDGVFFMWMGQGRQNIHRHRHIEGYCNKIPKGTVRVGFSVGDCKGYGNADASSGWNSVSRIVIEEVRPPQS